VIWNLGIDDRIEPERFGRRMMKREGPAREKKRGERYFLTIIGDLDEVPREKKGAGG